MIDVLIFSRDRPAQLDLLLRSLDRFAPALFSTRTVLYRHGPEYALGYQYVRQDHPRVAFKLQDVFDVDVRAWLWERHYDQRHVCFLVDDDVFWRSPGQSDRDGFTRQRPPGNSTTGFRLQNDYQGLPLSLRCGDYDYPLSLDGVIYRPSQISGRLPERFNDPTQLEAGLDANRRGLQIDSALPCLVGVPHNVVSPSSGMPSLGGSAGELNVRFLRGERIDLDATIAPLLSGDVEPAAHVALEYAWTFPAFEAPVPERLRVAR